MLVAASVIAPGYFHHEVGLLYRKWPGQMTASAEHTEPVEWQLRMSLIRERAESITGLLANVHHSAGSHDHTG
ncbi:MAG: hypothetical protein JO100_02290 [Pseudonocardia sp.]|nr:hypothetical protein [Pseudonocardia sp.]